MRIIIVDDDALIRDGLKVLFEIEEDFEVIDTVSNGQEAFDLCKKELPDIVLMDIRMPVMDGVLGTKLIKEHFSNVKVIILTTFKDEDYIKEAMKAGAEGYILKNQSSDSIIESIRIVMKGNIVMEKDIAKSLSNMISNKNKNEDLPQLSKRDFEILKLLADGLSNKEISRKLFLGEGTIRNYITNLLEKLDLRDRTQLAIYYIRNYE
ncbi:MAG: response regulator transcription factor [Clostridiales bacterium]